MQGDLLVSAGRCPPLAVDALQEDEFDDLLLAIKE
jgi:hypothetical protein